MVNLETYFGVLIYTITALLGLLFQGLYLIIFFILTMVFFIFTGVIIILTFPIFLLSEIKERYL